MDKASWQKLGFYGLLLILGYISGTCRYSGSLEELAERGSALDSAVAEWESERSRLVPAESFAAAVAAVAPDTVRVRILRTRVDSLIDTLRVFDGPSRDSLEAALRLERDIADSSIARLARMNTVLLRELYQRDSLLSRASALLREERGLRYDLSRVKARDEWLNCVGGIGMTYGGTFAAGLGVTCGVEIF